ncbi:hypothetical protein, partial [Xanthomonas citri]|uniref:hypothetical protein n=1 Tax=Xanthomonas citri TaxID=346 RepID=UPI001689AAEA
MNAQARYQQQLNGERSISPFIPYSSQVSPDTIVTLEGDYVRTWRLAGLAGDGRPEELLQRK